MKKRAKYIAAGAVIVAAVVAMLIISLADVTFSANETANGLIKNCLTELCGAVCAVAVGCLICGKELFLVQKDGFGRSLLWCIPCLLCVLANFPFSALITKTTEVERGDLIWLFAVYCLLVGIFEEILFRGICRHIVWGLFEKNRYKNLLCVLVTSLIFACWHLFNLTSGNVSATLLQVGYSFLIGAMLAAVMLRCGNIYACIVLHAIFDFGGLLIPTLGSGSFQDATFWILTAVFGTLCCIHVFTFLIKSAAPTPTAEE